jgi:hypothetical protein
MRRTLMTGLILLAVLTACGGASSNQSSGRGNDLDIQAARMAAIGGCSLAVGAQPAQGTTSPQLLAIQNAFYNTSGPVYPGAAPLLLAIRYASTPAAETQALHRLQQWCATQGFATK